MDINTTAAAAAKLANRIDALRAEGLDLADTLGRVRDEVIASWTELGLEITPEAKERAESFVLLAFIASMAD